MRKNSGSMRFSGFHTTPGTPEYGDFNGCELPKPWSSERVPVTGVTRSQISSAALMPFNSGRVLPSKWDDAERWITSPISAVNPGKSSVSQPQPRPKSKSGPLAPAPGHEFLAQFSPAVPAILGGGGKEKVFITNSSFSIAPDDGPSLHHTTVMSDNSSNSEIGIMRSNSLTGLSELLAETSVPCSSNDGKFKDEERSTHSRDVGTQMSPQESAASSPRGRLSFSAFSSANVACFKDEIRDVQVDKGANFSWRRTREKANKGSGEVTDLRLSWNAASEASRNTSKLQREEAKITAWENLQKAKAEAAIRKLEMNLEKKRSAAMNKITSKLRSSQMKAEAMRIALSKDHSSSSSSSCCFFLKPRRSSKFLICRRI